MIFIVMRVQGKTAVVECRSQGWRWKRIKDESLALVFNDKLAAHDFLDYAVLDFWQGSNFPINCDVMAFRENLTS